MTNREAVGCLCTAAFCGVLAGLLSASGPEPDDLATLFFRLAVAFGLIALAVLAWNLLSGSGTPPQP